MKKLQIAIVIGVILSLFAGADFYLNDLGKNARFDRLSASETPPVARASAPKPPSLPPVFSRFKAGDILQGYQVKRQTQVGHVFEKIDLSRVKNIRIYRNELEKTAAPPSAEAAGTPPAPSPQLLNIYEIQGVAEEGSLTYLAVKLQFIAQINAATSALNEDRSLGENNFFLNDQGDADITFLVTQIRDHLYGFQFSKQNSQIYEDVKAMTAQL